MRKLDKEFNWKRLEGRTYWYLNRAFNPSINLDYYLENKKYFYQNTFVYLLWVMFWSSLSCIFIVVATEQYFSNFNIVGAASLVFGLTMIYSGVKIRWLYLKKEEFLFGISVLSTLGTAGAFIALLYKKNPFKWLNIDLSVKISEYTNMQLSYVSVLINCLVLIMVTELGYHILNSSIPSLIVKGLELVWDVIWGTGTKIIDLLIPEPKPKTNTLESKEPDFVVNTKTKEEKELSELLD